MSNKTITVRQSMAPDVTFQASFFRETKASQIKDVLGQWEHITGLAFTRMPQTDLSGDVFPGNEGYVVVQVEHPMANRAQVTLFWPS